MLWLIACVRPCLFVVIIVAVTEMMDAVIALCMETAHADDHAKSIQITCGYILCSVGSPINSVMRRILFTSRPILLGSPVKVASLRPWVSLCEINQGQAVSLFHTSNSPPFDQCQHLSPPPAPLSLFSPLLTLWCLWSLKPCQIEFVIISFSPWGQGYSYCLCVRVRVGLRDVLSASIIQEVSASAAHVMLLGGWAGDGARGVRREGGDWRKDVADLFLVAFRAFPYSLLHHFVILCS